MERTQSRRIRSSVRVGQVRGAGKTLLRTVGEIAVLSIVASTLVGCDGDTRAPVNPDDWRFIVQVEVEGGGSCTGFLVEPDVVMTAAHCVTGSGTVRRVRLLGGPNRRSTIDVKSSKQDPHAIRPITGEIPRHDRGYLLLDHAVDDVRPVYVGMPADRNGAFLPENLPLVVGQTVTLVSRNFRPGPSCHTISEDGGLTMWTAVVVGQYRGNPNNNREGEVIDDGTLAVATDERWFCMGDSGMPYLLRTSDGWWAAVAVYSGQTPHDNDVVWGTPLSVKHGWEAAKLSSIVPSWSIEGRAASRATGTPRAQFWTKPGYAGDKLDKDIKQEGQRFTVRNLADVKRGCFIACSGDWNDVITSVTTNGGGQRAVGLIVYGDPRPDTTERPRDCLYIPAGRAVPDLSKVLSNRVGGGQVWKNWAGRISAFTIIPGPPYWVANTPLPDRAYEPPEWVAGCDTFYENLP